MQENKSQWYHKGYSDYKNRFPFQILENSTKEEREDYKNGWNDALNSTRFTLKDQF